MQVLGGENPDIKISVPGGEERSGTRSPDLGKCRLVGRLWDLAKAYRQLPRDPSQAHVSIVAVFHPMTSRWIFFEQLAMAFGETSAVFHFNLAARGLQFILTRLFAICCSHFFDDFPVVDHAVMAKNTTFVVDQVLDLLGWDLKEQSPFARVFEPLGVVVDLSHSAEGFVEVSNKESRIRELRTFVDDVRSSGQISAHEARQLRGRFVFSRGQVFGRCGAPALRLLGAVAEARGPSRPSLPIVCAALEQLMEILVGSPPRLIRASFPTPAVIFVDGACHPGERLPSVGVGACLFIPALGICEYFGCRVGSELVEVWANRPDQQVIAQAELVPCLISLSTWGSVLRNLPTLIFIDNDSARFGLISGYSAIAASAALITATWELISRLSMAPWFGRVPTVCNLADGPSRCRFAELEAWPGAKRVEPSFHGACGAAVWPAIARRLRSEPS